MKEWYFESNYLPLLYIKLIHAVRQSSEVVSWAIQIIENQYANEINSIVFVADRIADMFQIIAFKIPLFHIQIFDRQCISRHQNLHLSLLTKFVQ
jgi:hypothetical protein